MNKSFRPALRLSAVSLLLAAGAAQAHQIWIEQAAGANERAVVRFGEFGENLREASPGLLDKFGQVRFDLPWKGQYVAEVAHTDKTAGERQGPKGAEKYDGVSYVTSLTVLKADGVEPIAAGPAATPNK
ncbi:hypothetical protein [Roseateles sp.]|uniref:hypothetical protein n=1 Tax=Roseateles sp. TaxID=1971397 RepID=UPI002F3E9C3F